MLREKKYTISLKTKEPLRIGGKKDPLSSTDNPVSRISGKLVIPGSSLKGALRAEIEKFLIDSHFQNGKWKEGFEHHKPCIPGAELSKDEERLTKEGKYREQNGNCRYPCDTRQRGCGAVHSICPACYLLGAMGLNGFLRIPFLVAEGPASELYSSRMDRSTKTISKGTNRPYELIPDGTYFTGTLSVLLEDDILNWKISEPRNLSDKTLGDKWLESSRSGISEDKQNNFIKKYIIERLEAINIMGGHKSKGFGLIEISVQHLD